MELQMISNGDAQRIASYLRETLLEVMKMLDQKMVVKSIVDDFFDPDEDEPDEQLVLTEKETAEIADFIEKRLMDIST